MHLVGVCRPKKLGGLGRGYIKWSCIIEFCCRNLHGASLLNRVRALSAKSSVGQDFARFASSRGVTPARWSYSWKGLVLACQTLANGTKWLSL